MKLSAIYIISILLLTSSCNNNSDQPGKEKNIPLSESSHTKPPANYQDTLQIDLPAAVFYHPDSLQLEKIKEKTDPKIFEATTHEYFFQMRNARMVIKKNWPALMIIEVKNARYLLFKGNSNDEAYIDLDTKNDPFGLFLFQPGKKPQLVDMMNIDTELGFYFYK
jgi:arylsulfatase A-like enzyme